MEFGSRIWIWLDLYLHYSFYTIILTIARIWKGYKLVSLSCIVGQYSHRNSLFNKDDNIQIASFIHTKFSINVSHCITDRLTRTKWGMLKMFSLFVWKFGNKTVSRLPKIAFEKIKFPRERNIDLLYHIINIFPRI